MLKRALLAYLIANFAIIGLVMGMRSGWYAGWSQSPLAGMLAQLALVMLPNLLLPFLFLRYEGQAGLRTQLDSLGWRWPGGRAFLAGGTGFILLFALSRAVSAWIGEPIPYQVPGVEPLSANTVPQVLALLVMLVLFVVVTVAAEESMFRGLLQARFSERFGILAGILAAALLYGLRHLPDDIFYAGLWNADSQMWISRKSNSSGGQYYSA